MNDLGQLNGFKDPAERVRSNVAALAGTNLPGGSTGPYTDRLARADASGTARRRCPCNQPPWGEMVAVNVNTGDIAWQVPLGVTDSLPAGKQNTGRPGQGGSIATAGGLVFIGATDDSRFRALDARTGKELWTVKLNASSTAVPSTYQGADGKQYVVLTSTGPYGGAPTADEIVAFALKK